MDRHGPVVPRRAGSRARAHKAIAVADRRTQARFVSAQMFYAIAARDIEREIVPLAEEEGLAIRGRFVDGMER